MKVYSTHFLLTLVHSASAIVFASLGQYHDTATSGTDYLDCRNRDNFCSVCIGKHDTDFMQDAETEDPHRGFFGGGEIAPQAPPASHFRGVPRRKGDRLPASHCGNHPVQPCPRARSTRLWSLWRSAWTVTALSSSLASRISREPPSCLEIDTCSHLIEPENEISSVVCAATLSRDRHLQWLE